MLTFKDSSVILSIVVSESGGIGRRARLRGVWGDSYGFKSRLSHQECQSIHLDWLAFQYKEVFLYAAHQLVLLSYAYPRSTSRKVRHVLIKYSFEILYPVALQVSINCYLIGSLVCTRCAVMA